MASIQKIERKGGVSYKITVSSGRGVDGKQTRHTKTFNPPKNMTARQADKEAQRVAFEFEERINQGYELDRSPTFAEYADYVMDLKERQGVKHSTLQGYKKLLETVNQAIGHIRLTNLRPQHLNEFYKNLEERGMRKNNAKAAQKADVDIKAMIHKSGNTYIDFVTRNGLSKNLLDTVASGKRISLANAQKIAKGLRKKVNDLFDISQNDEPLSCKTVLEYHRLISSILHQADKEMLVLYNAASKATPPKRLPHEAETFQPDDIDKMLECVQNEDIRMQVLLQLLIVTGCRRGEIVGLKWDKVDFENSQIKIDKSLLYAPDRGLYESTTKTNNTRFIKLPQVTMDLLKDYKREQMQMQLICGTKWEGSGYVLVNDFGGALFPDTVNRLLNNFGKKYGIEGIHPHKFRHTMASILFFNGMDSITISKRLGHAKVSTTTDIYSHIIKQADEAASDCIADVLFKGKGKKNIS